MKRVSFFTIIVAVASLVGFGFLVVLISMKDDATKMDFSDSYTKEARVASSVFICEAPNVRSEPTVIDDAGDGRSNSYGKTEEAWFDIDLRTVYIMDKPLDENNGYFIGLSVEEILSTPEGRHWFPSGIKEDPDGIVWIQRNYVAYETAR